MMVDVPSTPSASPSGTPSDDAGGSGGGGGEWTLVGRDEELALLQRVRTSARPAVVIAGAQGVGRSRLAAEALAVARTERWSTARVDGMAATASIPFGAVAHLAPPGAAASGDALRLVLATADHLRGKAARRPLTIAVDDAHLLDEASLGLVRRLVGVPGLFVLLTVRSDEHVPAPLVGLWKDGHADRLELQPLSRAETYHLVAQSLGDAARPGDAGWLWDNCLGNPLFLRELLLAEPGVVGLGQQVPDPGTAAAAPRLAALVRTRLGRLDDDQRTAVDALVVAGSLPTEVVADVVSPATVAALVVRGILVERHDAPEPTVALAHPAYDVVLRATLPSSQARALRGRLLDALGERDDGSPQSAIRLASLRLDHGADMSAEQLVVAARYAQAAFPQALAERLPVEAAAVDDLTAAIAAGPIARPSPHDLAVAERLARAAWDTDGSLAAGLSLTTTLVAQGRGDEAGQLATRLGDHARTEIERVQVALARAALRFWVFGDADGAIEVLRGAERTTRDGASTSRLRRLRAGIALNVGQAAHAAELAGELVGSSAPSASPSLAAMAAATGAAALAIGGRPAEAVALVDRFLATAIEHVDEIPEVVGQLMLARLFAARQLGRLDEAEAIAYTCYQSAAEQGSLAGMAIFTATLGQVAVDRGDVTSAVRRLREADVLLSELDSFGYRPWVLATLAMAHAQAGDAEAARTTHDLARRTTCQPRYFDADLDLAEAWCLAAEGRIDDARRVATAAADRARATGTRAFEAPALHALARLGDASPALAERLRNCAGAANPLVELFARHAAAVADDDATALDAVAAAFEEIGAALLAAEAAAQAGAAHERHGSAAAARRSSARSRRLADPTAGARTPALAFTTLPTGLTPREREVASLAAQGLTSTAIAERLVVSPRTVESHLYRIFAKLGITNRRDLHALL